MGDELRHSAILNPCGTRQGRWARQPSWTNLLLLRRYNRRPGQLSRYSDSLRAGRSGDRIPVGAKFSAPVQTGPGAHPASYTMGNGSFPWVKWQGSGADPPSTAEFEGRVELYICSPSGPSWPVLGRPLPLPLPTENRPPIHRSSRPWPSH